MRRLMEIKTIAAAVGIGIAALFIAPSDLGLPEPDRAPTLAQFD